MAFVLNLLKKIAWVKCVLLLSVIAALVTLVVVGFRYRWWHKLESTLGIWFWLGLLLLLVGLVLITLFWFLPRKQEQHFLADLHAKDEEHAVPGEQERYARLQQRMQEAVRTLRHSPELRKQEGLPLYALPWYLLLGSGQSGKSSLLRTVAKSLPPFERLGEFTEGPTPDCDWWFFTTAVMLDTTHAYAFPLQDERDGSLWYRLLVLLRHFRDIQPINGLIITLAADACVTHSEEALRQEAVQLRRRIDEAIEELGVDFPVYVLITRCDLLEGFTEFCDQLPAHLTEQAFGSLRDDRPAALGHQTVATTAAGDFDTLFRTLTRRLQDLRLSIYHQEHIPTATLRQKVFCFPEEFQALQRPLQVCVETLFQVNPLRPTPFFRGIFFCSAQQQGQIVSLLRPAFHTNGHERSVTPGDKPYFLRDLFATVLPRDQSLVRPTSKASKSRRLRHLLGLGGCVALCCGVLLGLTHAFVSDRRIRAALTADNCVMVDRRDPGGFDLQQAARCRASILGVGRQNQHRVSWSRFLFNRSGKRVRDLQEQYVQRYATAVLAPLDGQLEQALHRGNGAIPVVFLLIKRIELSQRCRSWRGCPLTLPPEQQPDYQLMLTPNGQGAASPAATTTLQQTYEAYLHWASFKQEVLQQEYTDHAERLRQWFATNKFAPTQILHWANQRYPPVTLQHLWPVPPTSAPLPPPQVDGAYTKEAWQQSLEPFLQRAEAAVPIMRQALQEFRTTYRTQYFAQWHTYVSAFPSGELPWWQTAETRRQLVPHLLSAASPYTRVFDLTFAHVKPHLPPALVLKATAPVVPPALEGKKAAPAQDPAAASDAPPSEQPKADDASPETTEAGDQVPEWIREMVRYLGSTHRRAYEATLRHIGEALSDDALRDKSFKLAKAGFEEEVTQEEPKHLILKADWLVQQFQAPKAPATPPVQAVWQLLERPVRFAWKVILEEAGTYFQKRWAENVIAPAAGLAELESINFLYGPEGKVRAFVDEFLRPFLADNETRPRQILEEEIPLSVAFLHTLQNAKHLKPVLEAGKQTPQRVSVEVTRPSSIDSQTNIVAEHTEFKLDCAAKTFRASMPRQDDAGPSTTAFWSFEGCGDVVLTTVMSCNRQCVERAAAVGMSVPEMTMRRLSKRYRGQEGFFDFVKHFRDGAHAFGLQSFADSYAIAEWQKLRASLSYYGISTIRMHIRVEVPPGLERLIALKSDALVPQRLVK